MNCESVTDKRASSDRVAASDVMAANYIYQQYGDGPPQLFYLDKHDRIDIKHDIKLPRTNLSATSHSERQQVEPPPSVSRTKQKPILPRRREKPTKLNAVPQSQFPDSVAKLLVELHSPLLAGPKPQNFETELPPFKPIRTNSVRVPVEDKHEPKATEKSKEPEVKDEAGESDEPDDSQESKETSEVIEAPVPIPPSIHANSPGLSTHNGFSKPRYMLGPHYSPVYNFVPFGNKRPPKPFLLAPPPAMRPMNSPKPYYMHSGPLRRPPMGYGYKLPRTQPRRPKTMKFYTTIKNVPPPVRKAMRHLTHTYKAPMPAHPPVQVHPNHNHKSKSKSKSEEESSEREVKHKSQPKKEQQHSKDDTSESEGSESAESSRKRGHKSEKTDEKGSYETNEKGFEKSGGSKYNEEEHKKKGFADSKEYSQFDSFGKGKKGQYDEEDYHEFDDAEYESKASKSNADDQHKQKHAIRKGENSGKFDEKKSHKKGSKTSGYHNVFHKDEYKKVHTFYDDADHRGKFKKYGFEHSQYDTGAGAAKSNKRHHASTDEDNRGVAGKTRNGLHSAEDTGHRKKHGHERHHSDAEKHSGSGGKRQKHEREREHDERD